MTEAQQIIFYVAPFVLFGVGMALGSVLKEYFMTKKLKNDLKKYTDDNNDS